MSNDQDQESSQQPSTTTSSDTTHNPTQDQVPGTIMGMQILQDSFDMSNLVVKNKLKE